MSTTTSGDRTAEDVPEGLIHDLLAWYAEHKRELPWRSQPEPYRVWVSEIMLQQTQVATVLPYFARWMERFPTVEALAEASLDDVLAAWSGLGYYRRARFLHKAAQEVVAEHGGALPGTVEGLLKIPGIGRYTAGAIASIAFGVAAPIVDGNVVRILARLFAVEGDTRSTEVQRRLWALAEQLVPDTAPGDFNQAMMELGATVCTPKKPMCLLCPVAAHCKARALGAETRLPEVRKAPKKRPMVVASALLRAARAPRVLLVQRPAEGLFGGLWEFPSVVMDAKRKPPEAKARAALKAHLDGLGLRYTVGDACAPVVHLLSHIRMTVMPFHATLIDTFEADALGDRPARWVALDALADEPLAAVTRKQAAYMLEA